MPNPAFRIEISGQDSTMLNDRLLSITITDQAGSVNDSATISLDDRDEMIVLPTKGDTVEVFLGYEQKDGVTNPYDGLKSMGTFTVDEIKHGGPPEVLTIICHAFDTGSVFKQQRTGQFHRKKLGEIIQIIAERNGLEPRCHKDLGEIECLKHVHYRAQSDMALVESLANKVGAVAKVQDGKLYFAPLGKISEVADPDTLPPTVSIKRVDMWNRELTDQSRSEVAQVDGRFYDKDEGDTEYASAEGEAREPVTMELSADFPSACEALLAANSRADRMKKARYGFSFTTQGQPELMAETTLLVEGQRAGLPDSFLVTQAIHTFTDGEGYTTSCSCIVPEEE